MKRRKAKRPAGSAVTMMVLRLYIADSAPNSAMAIANLAAICKEHFGDEFELEIIDVLEYPQRAFADGIIVTPSLTKVSPSPLARIVGNLSDTKSVLRALGIA